MELIAKLLNLLMPGSWKPPRWMWQYDFVRRKRGKRRCAHCNLRGEPTDLLSPFTKLEGVQMTDGRTMPLAVAKRTPFLCYICLSTLNKQELHVLVLTEDGKAHFRDKKQAESIIKPGPGLKHWIGSIN